MRSRSRFVARTGGSVVGGSVVAGCLVVGGLVVAGCLALAACGSTTNGALVAGPGASGGAGRPTAGATPTTAPALAQRLHLAADSVTSSRFTVSGSLLGRTFTGSGVQRLSQGKPTAYRITEVIPDAGTLGLIKTGSATYVRLPTVLGGSTSKPWQRLSTDSSNPLVRQFATSLQSTAALSSLDTVALFTRAVSSLKVLGSATVNGVHATHYALTVDVAKLPDSFPNLAALRQAGVATLPLELWIDDTGRPVRLTEKLTVSGETVTTALTMGHFNEPVSISPPPASQIAPS